MISPSTRVAVICTGNICRSPMGEVLLRALVEGEPRLAGHVLVTSAGTASWHVGEPMDDRARRALNRADFSGAGSPAAYASPAYLASQDLILVMTREHRDDVRHRLGETSVDVTTWRSPSRPDVVLDVADPYYGDDADFDECLAVLRRGEVAIIDELLRRRHGPSNVT